MADLSTTPVLSPIATVKSKLSNLAVKDGQLVFVQDKNEIAFDFGGSRKVYKQIEELATDDERASLLAPVNGFYYYVVDPGVLWTYQDGWIQLSVTEVTDEDIAALFES